MCDDCKKAIGKMKKKKRAKVSGFDTDGIMRIAKRGGCAAGGFVLGEYVNKALENTEKPDQTPNAGLVGAGKVVVSLAVPSFVQDEVVQDVCIGLFISGAKDLIVANAADFAGQIGLHGIQYPDYYMPDYNGAIPSYAGGAYTGNDGGRNASGKLSRVAM